jgi:phosphatidylserine/phosphatidylglycerophosphate/cardiolipin synthase-like enzyme
MAAPTIAVHFSPAGGCTSAIVAALAAARTTVDVLAYSFTSAPIAKALLDAHRRGVAVRVVVDQSQRTARGSVAGYVAKQGVPVWVDAQHAIAHSKCMTIDGAVVLTGSFNFTGAAETSNAENLLTIASPAVAAQYAANFAAHLGHSTPYRP